MPHNNETTENNFPVPCLAGAPFPQVPQQTKIFKSKFCSILFWWIHFLWNLYDFVTEEQSLKISKNTKPNPAKFLCQMAEYHTQYLRLSWNIVLIWTCCKPFNSHDLITNSPLAAVHFLGNNLWEFDVRSRLKLVPDEFEYSHYLFAGRCMDIKGEVTF